MRKRLQSNTLLLILFTATVFTSCVKDSYLADPPVVANQSFMETFDTMSAAYKRGWRTINNSDSIGQTDWSNPSILAVPFSAFSSKSTKVGYAWVDYLSTSAQAQTISNWLVSPVVYLKNGDQISFYSRAELLFNGAGDSTDYANRLQVAINSTNTSLTVGTFDSYGDFNNVILDINPFLAPFLLSEFNTGAAQRKGAYPHRWTKFTATVTGLSKPTWGRFGLRYYVDAAGSNGNATSIGVDELVYTSK